MTKKSIISGFIFGTTALILSAGSAMAAPKVSFVTQNQGYELITTQIFESDLSYEKQAQRQISASQAKSIAMSQVRGGEYIDLRKSGNTYIVRIRDRNGRVVDIKIDATTGRVK